MSRVLIIDDDKSFISEAAEELQLLGHQTVAAVSYGEAIQALQRESFDVISLDIMMRIMPDEDVDREAAAHGKETGLMVFRRLSDLAPHARVVVCTVIANRVRGRLGPGVTLLEKPVGVDDYVNAIQAAVAAASSSEANSI